jgi:hypothetical protein
MDFFAFTVNLEVESTVNGIRYVPYLDWLICHSQCTVFLGCEKKNRNRVVPANENPTKQLL